MKDELDPKAMWWMQWLALDDGISRSRGRPVLNGESVGSPAPESSPVLAVQESGKPPALAKSPDISELLEEALRLFDAIGEHIPQRISDEELGDALESIHKMVAEGQPRWKIQVKILSTLFWVSAHSVQDYVHETVGTVTAATGNNGGKRDK